jgi:hypothetical protein
VTSSTPSTFTSGGVRVAVGLAAGGLVVDRRHEAEHALTVHLGKHARTRGDVDVHQRLLRRVTEVAGLSLHVDELAPVSPRREGDAPLLVQHAYFGDADLLADGGHHLVDRVPAVRQHGVPGAAGDGLRDLIGAQDHLVQELPLLVLDGLIEREALYHDDDQRQGSDQPRGQPFEHVTPKCNRFALRKL